MNAMNRILVLIISIGLYSDTLREVVVVKGDSLHPRRPKTEEAFIAIGHHESSNTVDEMNAKIKTMEDRRKKITWETTLNPQAKQHFDQYNATRSRNNPNQFQNPPNILFILADDLGYGDTSVKPFVFDPDANWPCCEGGILTPNLERMAEHGTIATNFHSSAPVCSPSRVSAMTGLYPWRLGALNAFELGRDLSQRNGFLPQIYATTAELLRDNGYYTAHSGKWHLGGMREEQRVDRVYKDVCTYPSPNQHGFDDFVSALDGPESPRYTFFMNNRCLHSKGHRHLLKNDVPMPKIDNPPQVQNVLSDHEVQHAINFMTEHRKRALEQPWFIQIWFNAPHGPWENIESGQAIYCAKYHKNQDYYNNFQCTEPVYETLQRERWWYKTMVSAMDNSIGKLLDALKVLDIERETLVIFTSDNGQEDCCGSAGPYQGGKRSLLEGGVRVPAIFQWPGTIPQHAITTSFGAMTDLLPTFLDAAGIKKPDTLYLDGISLLPVLTKAIKLDKLMAYHNLNKHSKKGSLSEVASTKSHVVTSTQEFQSMLRDLSKLEHHSQHHHSNNPFNVSMTSNQPDDAMSHHSKHRDPLVAKFGSNGVKVWPSHDSSRDRIFLWHKDTDPYRKEDRFQSAAYFQELKIITSNTKGCLDRVFDLRHDPYEHHNLVKDNKNCHVHFGNYRSGSGSLYASLIDKNEAKSHCEHLSHDGFDVFGGNSLGDAMSFQESCLNKYHSTIVSKIAVVFPKLAAFVKYGNMAHQQYLSQDKDKTTCDIPLPSQTKPLRWFSQSFENCSARIESGCSVPEY